MTQHTPGPWTVDVEDECRVIDVQDCTVARTDYVEIEEERDWQVANAALIAAAPAMLEALREALAALSDIRNAADNGQPYTTNELLGEAFDKPSDDAFNAIAAAEGK